MSDRTLSERAPSRLQVESCSGSVTNRNSWRSPPQSGVGSRAPLLPASCCSPSESEPWAISSFADRVIARLEELEKFEQDPWYADDIRIARLTVIHAWRGDAVECSPHVLATYELLGVHPNQVWPKIEARRAALGPLEVKPVRKKPVQSVSLWCEKTNAARAATLRGGDTLLRDNTISVPMAAPSIAALYRNPDEQSSAKTRPLSYSQLINVIRHSFAPWSVKRATLNALSARGPWPENDGPANGIICVSLDGMALGDIDGDGACVRSTARWRARQAVKHNYWRKVRDANSWSNCRKCGAERVIGRCEKCGYVGRAKTPEGKPNFDEFCRPYMYEIDIEKFRTAPPPKGIRHFCARTWKEHKEAAKRGEHPNLVEMPERKSPQPTAPPTPPAPAAPLPQREKPAAEHRSPAVGSRQHERLRQLRQKLSERVTELQKGVTSYFSRADSLRVQLYPGDEGYSPPMARDAALAQACRELAISEAEGREVLKLFEQKSP